MKLSALPAGSAIADGDMFYSAPLAGGQVKQSANAFRIYAGVRTQRLVVAAITVQATDQIINCNIATATSVTLPLASTRAGKSLTFKDVGGQFGTNPLTINRTAPDTIDGLTSVTLSINYQAMTFTPANDGTTTGWYLL